FPRADVEAYLGGATKMSESQSGPPIETTQAAPPDLAQVTYDQFMETDLRVAEIRAAERVPKSKKLIKLSVFDGEKERTLVAGIATKYTPEELVGRKVVIVANLKPATLMGIESNGMVLAASIGGEPSLIAVDPSVPAGTNVKGGRAAKRREQPLARPSPFGHPHSNDARRRCYDRNDRARARDETRRFQKLVAIATIRT
ncbi:MAG: methionine--tRNA ligase subunit beta, partial [Thermoanaerobaculia bacterium]